MSFVYLMKDLRNNFIKIGYSKNPTYREKTLQSEQPLIELINAWEGEITDERKLHKQFAEKRIRGEWFQLDEKDLETIQKGFKKRSKFQSKNSIFLLDDGTTFYWQFAKPLPLSMRVYLIVSSFQCNLEYIEDQNAIQGIFAKENNLKGIYENLMQLVPINKINNQLLKEFYTVIDNLKGK